jgi:hypothetical protein
LRHNKFDKIFYICGGKINISPTKKEKMNRYAGEGRLTLTELKETEKIEKRKDKRFATWGYSMFQGLGCLPIKAVRELGLERRDIVRFISGVGVSALREPFPSMRGSGRTHLLCTNYRAHNKYWVAKCGVDNC